MDGDASRAESKDKGKGKADGAGASSDEAPSHTTDRTKSAGTSLPRMAQSAASFLLSGPPGEGLGASHEKGDSSRVSKALARAGESSVQLRPNAQRGAAMRMGQAQEHIAQEEASFSAFLDSGSAPMLSEPSSMENAWQSAVPRAPTAGAIGTLEPVPLSVAEQEARDGVDVATLLSGHGDLDQVFDHANEPPALDDLAGLREALFGERAGQGSSSPIAWDDVLNFIPEFLRAPDNQLSMHMGTSHMDEAWQTWIDQWSRVLTSYQDEVWGDLGSLVEEARSEVRRIEEAKPGEKPPEPTALLRLRAILGHLRGP
ncbi:uncharacterized protein B0H64DRAFT_91251 [Chaetomium fimeti]|uniref:Uncharacterized protein n=1 Tax=Chaetomium fimeti TaxID=1854472 RepID=A0AAE0HM73_9PEZI|nr:hypothetical protein B0H64DRAFT_91251 [Chaetomium fimeti]